MARFNQQLSDEEIGKLIIKEIHPNYIEVFYIPPDYKLAEAGLDPNKAEKYKTLLLSISGQDNFVEIFPINTLPKHDEFLKPKYNQIRSIVLNGFDYGDAPQNQNEVMEILEELPLGFIKDYDYGLGFQKDYRFIVSAVEEIEGIHRIVISNETEPKAMIQEGVCTIDIRVYNKIRKEINKVTNRAQIYSRKVKAITAHNFLSYFLNDSEYPMKTFNVQNDTLHRLIVEDSNNMDLSIEEQKEAIQLVSKNKKAIAKQQPESLAKLHNDIELVTLERLIEKYEEMLGKKLREEHWQKLFSENPFILGLTFGCPIIKIQSHAFIGGKKLSGDGDKITDFLVKNSLTDNTAIFEIKKPSTTLFNKTPYREGVYTPHSEFSGAITQLLDQQYQFQKGILSIKEASRIYDLETYSVHGVLIIGLTPNDVDQKKSLELFRGNSKGITIITFDELLERLKQLYLFLT